MMALAFASGVNLQCEPGIAGPVLDTARRFMKPSAPDSTQPLTPTQKSEQAVYLAYRFLMQADAYLAGEDRAQAEANAPIALSTFWSFNSNSREQLSQWAKRVSKEEFTTNKNAPIAIDFLNKALVELNLSTDDYSRLYMYWIASNLLHKAGDEKDSRKCEQYIEDYIQLFETGKSINEKQLSVAVSLLNIRAYNIVAVNIPDAPPSDPTSLKKTSLPGGPPSPRDIASSEAFWLRSAALADRLQPTADLRRMVHRNLSLWYQIVGKNDQAEEQKLILFSLIGKHDDRLLYPSNGFCGHLAWWVVPQKNVSVLLCGMG
ncbi:MAG: hypothetical protein P4L53_26865 [Candidatus Obscuribacterales bacterium]|nr:hypothetical protein [Candidatus Obscuribacterales bacterium]